MPRSSSPSSSSLSDILTDVESFDPESSTATNSNPPLPPTNAFTALGSIPSRKRALVYVGVEKDPKRPRTSAIWVYGREVRLENSTNGQRFWECNLCHTRLTASATTNAGTHLRKIHMIKTNSDSPTPFTLTVMDQQLQGVEQQQLNNTSLPQNLSLQERLVRFVTICHIPYNAITSKHFRSLFLCSPTATTEILPYLPTSHNTIQAWTQKEFDKSQKMVWNMLKKSQGAINLSFDLWTSPNGLGLNAIIAHFVDSEYNIRTILIGLREVMGEHSGENIGQTVVEVIREFQLEASLNVFVLDNARSNDTAVYYILNELDLEDTHLEDHCRLRCLGHIINLAAQDFIFGKNSKEWLKEHTAVENTDDLEEQQKSWVS